LHNYKMVKMSFDNSDFRHCLGCFATGVTVITTMHDDRPYGVTINSFSSLSLQPPLVLFSLDKSSHIYEKFSGTEKFTVNILSEKQENLSRLYAHPGSVDWKNIAYTTGKNNCPILKGAIAYLECVKENIHDGGDHTIFVGRVENLQKVSEEAPLLYFKGKYGMEL
jgi:flavin reductase (DIM6/NTAB) family NADH-FMN oxidoreductase RutF